MHFLHRERETLERLLPGLDAALAGLSLAVTERPGNPALSLYRQAGGTDLLLPPRLGGLGASPLEVLHLQRALGSRSPSLAVAVSMHLFTVASLLEWYTLEPLAEVEALLRRIVNERLYLALAYSEGRSGASILSSQFQVELTASGLRITGSKKPCSLSRSMHLLTASVLLPALPGQKRTPALLLIPPDSPGVQRRPFWNTWVLAGAESDEVFLDRVEIPWDRVHRYSGPGTSWVVQQRGVLWFELLIAGAYLGAGSALVERVLLARQGTPIERTTLVGELETIQSALECVARDLEASEHGTDAQARALLVRFNAQHALDRACSLAAELLGGTAFVASGDVACLLASASGLAVHPPARTSVVPALDGYLFDGRFGSE
jgi:alkylation response protein AidB-like acyl-CoA dehydrogenase